MAKYDHKKIERKWQKVWKDKNNFAADDKGKKSSSSADKGKMYVLDMFPYPSGSGLHVGHVEGYTATDIYSRAKRMQGYNVLHPMGWDAFGLPAENYAVKTGVHPKETTETAIKAFKKLMDRMGFSYDWNREIGTHTPEYYKWTQWFFLLLYKNGLAYKAKANVNWCPSCQTVLANEQVVNGKCERCGTEVTQKELEQWFFKITDFAEELIADLDQVDWPESTKINQRNWIGKKTGINITYKIDGGDEEVVCFTTRPDTNFGATFIVLGPEHPLAEKIALQETREEVQQYIQETKDRTEEERIAQGREKTGVFTGRYAVNNLNGNKMPIWVSDFVLGHVGTGAVVGVPGHDLRDFQFAKTFNLPVIRVVVGSDKDESAITRDEQVQEESGTMVNSEFLNGLDIHEATQQVMDYLEEKSWGKRITSYHLRDWLVSRQRYWGAPIPIVYDAEGNAHPVPEEHLPWMLPTDVEFKPTGYSPLADSKEFVKRTEKIFGKGWKPEVDTMDTFVCSSWYYYRFADPKNEKEFASKEAIQQWVPVDVYMGGAEHTVLHLMYARFFTKVLRKLGYIDFAEPFKKLRHQGMILAENGIKMSKSKGNVVSADDIIEEYGADVLRMYEMFLGPIDDMKPWDTRNIIGLKRFLDRVWNVAQKTQEGSGEESLRNKTIKKVTEDIENLHFNTAIAALMEYSNSIGNNASKKDIETLLILLAPFAPYMAEELWENMGNAGSVHEQEWPQYDEKKIQQEKSRLVIQVNGKVRNILEVESTITEKEAKELALKDEKVQKWLKGKQPKKVIFVAGKLVNIVV